jgi:nucleotide-binding universal stress UspA family protein
VVVGVDGTEESRAALRYAIADAARRGARVRAVRAFEPPDDRPGPAGLSRPPTLEELTNRHDAGAPALAECGATDPGAGTVPLELVALPGSPGTVLVHQARDADLLVLGHRGRGPLTSALLGSVGLTCVLHARCPVTIVRTAPRAAEEQVGAPALVSVTPVSGGRAPGRR